MVKLFNVRQQSIVFSQLNAPSSIQKTADAATYKKKLEF